MAIEMTTPTHEVRSRGISIIQGSSSPISWRWTLNRTNCMIHRAMMKRTIGMIAGSTAIPKIRLRPSAFIRSLLRASLAHALETP